MATVVCDTDNIGCTV